jgi:hypothetical protein
MTRRPSGSGATGAHCPWFVGAEGGSRTHTGLPPAVFKTAASAIPPLRRSVRGRQCTAEQPASRPVHGPGVLSAHTSTSNGPAALRRPGRLQFRGVEATTRFELVNRGFADLPLNHLGTSPLDGLAGPRGFEPRFTDPKSAVLPLDEGPAVGRGPARPATGERPRRPVTRSTKNGAEDGTRTRDPHLGKVMLYQLSHFRPENRPRRPIDGVVPRARFELATPRFSVACSTN